MRVRTIRFAVLLASVAALFSSCDSTVDLDAGPGPLGPVGPQGDIGPGVTAEEILGSGTVVVEERDVSGFDRIDLAGEGTVIVSLGDEFSLAIETDDNLLEYLETSVAGKTLTLATTGSGSFDLEPTASITWRIEAPAISGMTVSGAGSFDTRDLSGDQVEAMVNGTGDIRLADLDVSRFFGAVNGVGTVIASGDSSDVELFLEGIGDIDVAISRPRLHQLCSTTRGISRCGLPTNWTCPVPGLGPCRSTEGRKSPVMWAR